MYRSTIIDIFKDLLVGNYNIRTILVSPVVLTGAGGEYLLGRPRGNSFVLILLFGIIALSCYARIASCFLYVEDRING